MINARAEGITDKPYFRDAFKTHRCLILADGFYEWRRSRTGKVPYRFILKDEEPFAFAGVWGTTEIQGKPIPSFSIVTTGANALVEKVHDRMPVILPEEYEESWLNPTAKLDHLKEMLRPYPAASMRSYEVSRRVNNAATNDPELMRPTN